MEKELNTWDAHRIDSSSNSDIVSPSLERTPSLEDVYKTLSAPLDAQIEVTTLCNEACVHCYNFWRGDKFRQSITRFSEVTLQQDNISAIVKELSRNRVFKVTFTGGEPFLFGETVMEGIRLAKDEGIDCSLNSNLTTITQDTARSLKVLGVDSILTSLHSFDESTHDGITQRKGSFRRTLRGIKTCLEEGLDVSVNMVVMRANQNQVFETGKFVQELGVKSFSATKAVPCLGGINFSEISISREAFERMLEDLLLLEERFGMNIDTLMAYPLCALKDSGRFWKFAQHSCGAGVTTCTIGANGDVRPCSFADESYGNIFSESLSQAWGRMHDWRNGSRLPEECIQNCAYFPLCGAGCRMEAKFAGNKKGMDPLATSPNDVISLPSLTRAPTPTDFWTKKIVCAKNLRLRKETFGGAVAAKGESPFLVDAAAYEILNELKDLQRPFSVQELEDVFDLTRDSQDFFYMLFTKGVFKEV